MWFREDVRNILLGVELANAHLAAGVHGDEVQAYRAGYTAAIIATAASFGIFFSPADLSNVLTSRAMIDAPRR